MTQFEKDTYPGKPKILFIGPASSSHTHSWIDLFDDAEFNVRLFGIRGVPPLDWPVKTYLADIFETKQPSERRRVLLPFSERFSQDIRRGYRKVVSKIYPSERWLAKVINAWKPDIVHTFGLKPSAYFYLRTRQNCRLSTRPIWVAQIRGGPDLALHRLVPSYSSLISQVMESVDQVIADNQLNYDYAVDMGLPTEKQASLHIVPGTGGIEIANEALSVPSQRPSSILWPKAYESPQSKALPIMEALKLAWEKIAPCEITLLITIQDEVKMWLRTLPQALQDHLHICERIPRDEALQMTKQARVLLAPSLSDGVPNVLYEAMVHKTFPIVSPLPTITPLVQNETNVLFARNLYPQEIADAIVRAMNDDVLVDTAAQNNLELVKRIANRAIIKPKVIDYYQSLMSATRA